MSGDFCRKCHEWAGASHVCPPVWELRDPERHDLDEWHLVYALNAERAAEQFVAQYERRDCEYPVASGGEVTILVREPGAKSAGVGYVVTGESVPTYHARLERPKKEHRTALDVVAERLERDVIVIVQEEAPELLRKVRGEKQADLVGRRVRLTKIIGTREGSLWQAGDELLITWTNAGLFSLRDFSAEKRVVNDVKRADFELCRPSAEESES